MIEAWKRGLKAPLIFGLAFLILPRKAVFPLSTVTPLMPLGSSPNETSRVGGWVSTPLVLSFPQPFQGAATSGPRLPGFSAAPQYGLGCLLRVRTTISWL